MHPCRLFQRIILRLMLGKTFGTVKMDWLFGEPLKHPQKRFDAATYLRQWDFQIHLDGCNHAKDYSLYACRSFWFTACGSAWKDCSFGCRHVTLLRCVVREDLSMSMVNSKPALHHFLSSIWSSHSSASKLSWALNLHNRPLSMHLAVKISVSVVDPAVINKLTIPLMSLRLQSLCLQADELILGMAAWDLLHIARPNPFLLEKSIACFDQRTRYRISRHMEICVQYQCQGLGFLCQAHEIPISNAVL